MTAQALEQQAMAETVTVVDRAADYKMSPTLARLSSSDQQVLRSILNAKDDAVFSRVFASTQAQRKLFSEAAPVPLPDSSWYHPVMDRAARTHGKVVSMSSVLLTASQERTLFLRFNYCRWMVGRLKKQARGGTLDLTTARQILHWHEMVESLRDQIAQTNLALVLAMAKRMRMSDVDFGNLVSEGNMALLRAIEKFDADRGFKFSTYACRAILKAFSRLGQKTARYHQLFPTDYDPKMERSDFVETRRDGESEESVDEIRKIILDNKAELTPIEQRVIAHRFAVGPKPPKIAEEQPLTLEQVGHIIGVTKERVRQIQNKALDKIRQTLEGDGVGMSDQGK